MLIGVVAGILILCALMPVIISHTLATELPVRIIITLVMLAIPAFLMGIPFPTGLVIVGKRAKPFIPWAWGANSGATVLGSIVAIIVAMTINFTGVILLGAASYLIAALVFMPFSKNPY